MQDAAFATAALTGERAFSLAITSFPPVKPSLAGQLHHRGNGWGRTTDLLLFRQALVPTELRYREVVPPRQCVAHGCRNT